MNQQEALNVFEYKNGKIYWKINRPNSINRGSRAGTLHRSGYRTINYKRKRYPEHHIVWLMHKGYLPKMIDHKNRKPNDNRIENLREISQQENAKNKSLYKTNTSGHAGVYFDKRTKKWVAVISKGNSKLVFLGRFANKKNAIQARQRAQKLLGYYPK